MIAPSDFDWRNDEDVILHEQPATAVYPNQNGAIVIRQERTWDEDSDTLIIIQPRNARAIANAILAATISLSGREIAEPLEVDTIPDDTLRAVAETDRIGEDDAPPLFRAAE